MTWRPRVACRDSDLNKKPKFARPTGGHAAFGHGVWSDIWLTIPTCRPILQMAAKASVNMAHSILVVDDDPHIRDVVRFAFEKSGMAISIAQNGKEALRQFDRNVHDLIVLDIGMPEMDGLEVCRQIRKSSDTPILFLSARDEEIDRVLGLEIGGDDYVTKPFSPRELVARVNAILRRTQNSPAPTTAAAKQMTHGGLSISPDERTVAFLGTPVSLTALEFSILRTLLARPGFVFTRELILDAAYAGNIHVADRTIDSHVRNIRAKVATAGCDSVIETVHGVGFKLGRCEASR
jgi:two-component system, OmpR family, response regulator